MSMKNMKDRHRSPMTNGAYARVSHADRKRIGTIESERKKLARSSARLYDEHIRRNGYDVSDYGAFPEFYAPPEVRKSWEKENALIIQKSDMQRKAVSNARRKRR